MMQSTEGQHPSSPRGSSESNMQFSLLGQPLTYCSQPRHREPQHQRCPSSPSGMNFSLGVQPQSHPGSLEQSQLRSSSVGGVMGSLGGGYANMQNASSLLGAEPVQDHQFMNLQVLQNNHGREFLRASHQQPQAPQFLGAPVSSGEALMNALQVMQQNIGQLQALVPLLSQHQLANPLGMEQAAAAVGAVRMITQLAQAAASMFPVQQPQQQPQPRPQQHQQPQQSIADPHQLDQLLGASVTPGFNLFQQPVGCSPVNSATVDVFSSLQGANRVNLGFGNTSNSRAGQLGRASAGKPSPNNAGSGVPASHDSPVGAQSFGGGGGQQGGVINGSVLATNSGMNMHSNHEHGSPLRNQLRSAVARSGGEIANMNRSVVNTVGTSTSSLEDHDVGGTLSRAEDDDGDTENLPPGSYELVEMDAMEILAEHTHFCDICGKGFKRDANLRMHMRGHGDEYKTPAALARPDKASHDSSFMKPRRFSCPFVGCKRNKKHRKFQPLKTVLCVKNHYRRSHCPKRFTCQKCKTKKFSVVADLKTHEKHCGCDKWQCSCGTTFSRKDKLFGHIGLFAGHTPALPFNQLENSGLLDVSDIGEGSAKDGAFQLSSESKLASGNAVAASMNLDGGNGMGLVASGLQSLATQGGADNDLASKDVEQDNSSSSDSFPQTGNFLPGSLLQGLFTSNFLQSTAGNASPDGLH